MRSIRMPPWARARLLRRGRLLLAAALLALAGLAALPHQSAATEARGVGVLGAARDLTGGVVLTAGDVRTVRLPAEVVPAGALAEDGSAVGRMLAGSVRRGEPLTDARVVGPGLTMLAGGPGSVAAPIRLADP